MKAVSRLTSFAGYGAKALFRGAGMALSLTVSFIGSDCFGRGMGTNELAALVAKDVARPVRPGGGAGDKVFTGVPGKIKSVKWTDCDGDLAFTQDGDKVTIGCTGYTYGKSLVVRVAEAEIE